MGLRRYRELLAIPGVRRLMLAAFVGRLPYGMSVVSLILLLRAHGFGYAAVGVITAASAFSIGVAAPVLGRVIDRVGQTRPLVIMRLTALTGAALVLAAAEGAGAALLTVLAFAQGLSAPPLPLDAHAVPDLVGKERVDTAFAFDSLQLELVFILGPLLAGALGRAISPEVGFLTAVALQSTGALILASSPHSRRWRPPPREPGERHTGALALPGLRVLVVSIGITALSLGVLEIAIAAFAEHHATRNAGWLFALWGLGSLSGGLWYGAREWHLATHLRYLLTTGVLAVGLAPLALAGSMPVFGVLVIVAGLGLAPRPSPPTR